MRTLTLLFVASLALLAGGCSPGEDVASETAAKPAVIATKFLTAVQEGNERGAIAFLTQGSKEALESGEGFSMNADKIRAFSVGGEHVNADQAEVSIEVTDTTSTSDAALLLRRERGAWRIWGMRIEFGDGGLILDFEETAGLVEELGTELVEEFGKQMQAAFADMQLAFEQGGTPEQIAAKHAAFDALTSVTPEVHTAAWRIDVSGAGRAVADVLRELVGPCGLSLGDDAPTELRAATQLGFRGVSRVEAVERLAASVGLFVRWPDASGVQTPDDQNQSELLGFGRGARPFPATFAGPFLIEATELVEEPPHAVGSLTLAVRALGIAPGVLAYQDDLSEVLRLERVRSADRIPLLDESMQFMSTPSVRDGYYVYTMEQNLEGLLRDVETVHLVAGKVFLALPTTVEEVVWERADQTPRRTATGLLTRTEWGEQTAFALETDSAEAQELRVLMAPAKSSGDPLGVRFSSSSGWGRKLTASLQTPEVPASVRLKICTTERLSVPFALGPLPLTRFAEQPEELEELTFAGATPVVLEVLRTTRRDDGELEASLRVRNRSNKDAVSVMVDLLYCDSKGVELKDFPHTLTGDYDFQAGKSAALVAVGATGESTAWAAFAPQGTTEIRARLRSVEFPDGTTWERQD